MYPFFISISKQHSFFLLHKNAKLFLSNSPHQKMIKNMFFVFYVLQDVSECVEFFSVEIGARRLA